MYEYARGLPRAEADALVDHAYETESSKRLDSMVKEGTWRLMADPAMFDRHPLYLNVGNGTLNLETMELEEHRAEDYLTSGLSLEYDSGAECPRWLEFLDQIFGGDQELIDYMQKVLGYTLTGRVGEQCLFFLFGSGKNGKSTLIRVVAGIMESLAGVIEISALTHGKSDSGSNPSPSLVSLRDKRFVSSREADENRGFSEGLIKDLTGGDTITARALYKDNITFQPQFKLFIYGNSKPTIKGQDEGIWRRMRIIPFEVEIPVKDRIEDYDAILLEEEGPGILAWMVRGTQAWMKEKLVTPARVLSSIEEYREENDYMAMFIEERLEAAPGATIDRDTLYAEYQGWAGMAGERVLSKRLFITRMKEKNVDYRREQMGGDRVFAGYRLRK
jgi:putative DNA primase/helicase